MYSFPKDKKILIVSDYLYSPALFHFKNLHPELNIKFMNIQEIKDIFSFVYIKDPIPYLIKEEGIEYNKAKKYAQLLKAPLSNNNPTLKALYNKLLNKGYIPLEKNPLDLYELRLYNIYLFEDNEDLELLAYFNNNGLHFDYLNFEDLDYEVGERYLYEGNDKIITFSTKFDQFFYLFSHLREILVQNKKKDNIHILCSGGEDLYYINHFSSLFKLDAFSNISSPMVTNKYVAKKVSEIKENKHFNFSEEELKNDDLCQLDKIIEEYGLRELDNFDYAYLNLLEIVNSKNIVETYSSKGITFSSTFEFSPYDEIYVTNFQDDVFYKNYQDNNVLTDAELLLIKANPSYILSRLDKRLKHNYIKYLNIKMLSRVEQHLSDKIYDSPFIKELKWNKEENGVKKYISHKDIDDVGFLTTEAYETYKACLYDRYFCTEIDENTNSYDHSFTSIKDIKHLYDKKDHLSVSSIKKFVSCPFKYYMDMVLPTIDDDKHAAWKGTLIHAVLEDIYKDDFDYETSFLKGKTAYYKEMEKNNYTPTKKEEMFLDIIHYWLYPIALNIRNEKNTVKLYFPLKRDYEVRTKYSIDSQLFTGSIDKLLFTDNELKEAVKTGTKKFYTIVDYKTGRHGSSAFDPRLACTGYDIQLPLYYYAIKEMGLDVDKASFGGMGIRHPYGSSIKDALYESTFTSEDILTKKLRIEGLFFNNADYYESFNKNNIDKNRKVKSKGTISIDCSKTFNYDPLEDKHNFKIKFGTSEIQYSLEEMEKDVIKEVKENIAKIKNAEFDIAPISNDILKFDIKDLTCKYCPYRDVCYRNIKDARNIRDEKIITRFFSKNTKKGDNLDA